MRKRIQAFLMTGLALAIPSLAFAEGKNLQYIINVIINYLNQALVLLIGLAVIIFVWYVIQYFIKPNEDRKNAGQYVMYSLIGFFVILSFWGLVNILQNTFGLQNEANRPASWASFQSLFPSGGSNNLSPGSNNTIMNTSPGSNSGIIQRPGSNTTTTGSPGSNATIRNDRFDPI